VAVLDAIMGARQKLEYDLRGLQQLHEKLLHYLLEAGRLLIGPGFGLCHLSGLHSFCHPRICSTALRQTAYSSSHCM